MNKKITTFLCFLLLLISNWTFSQELYNEKEGFEGKNLTSMHATTEWFKLMQVAEPNIFDVQKAYDKYFRLNTFIKSKETRAFEFWKKHVAADNYDENGFVGRQITHENDLLLIGKQRSGMQKVAGLSPGAANWSRIEMKPDMLPSWQSGSYTQGTCNMLAIHPTDTTQMIAAFIDGGTLWRTTDNCVTWTQVATNLMVRHFGAVVYCKSNPLIVYAGSKQGVIKSIDGGATWIVCSGLNNTAAYPTGNEIWAMEVKADDPNVVLCATGSTLYKTINGGTNWTTSTIGTNIRDIRALPGDPNVVFATFKTATWAEVRRSSNFGTTWAVVTGYPYSATGYTGELAMVAVSDAEPNSVWVELIAKETATAVAKTYGIYKSTDGGLNFTNTGITQDLTDKFWQGGWNQAFAISNTDPKIMAGGAYSTYVTKDGGLNWNADGSMGKTGPHSDVHGIVIRGNTVWMAGDGGITKTYNYGKAGTYIHNVDDGIQSHCLWGFDQGWKNDIMSVGMYHGPTTIRDDAVYTGWYPGPGADAGKTFVNKGDDRYIYAAPWGISRITRSTSRMTPPSSIAITAISNGINDMNDPDYYEKVYGVNKDKSKIMISSNNAASYTDSVGGFSSLSDVIVALTNNKIIYVRGGNSIKKSIDGGVTWSTITPTTLMGSQSISHIAVDGLNPQLIWATFGNKQTTIKVAKSTNGGTTWTNYSGGLPSYAINCIVSQMGSNGGVYIGTDAGVYYCNNTMGAWASYSTNLPLATHVGWIKINYAKAKLRIAGQTGIWESDLYSPSTPVAHPTTPYFESVVGKAFQFADMSVCLANATYEWTFPDGNPATSTLERPSVAFTTGGDKNITLKVTDANGTDTRTYNNFVRIRSVGNVAKTGWRVIYYDNQNSAGEAAANTIDGNNSTFWHTAWSGNPAYPHEIQIDMGSAIAIESFRYLPRQDGASNGTVKGYEWYVSKDGVNWGSALLTGNYASNTSEKVSTLPSPISARYFRFRATSEINGQAFASAAEIGINGSTSIISSFAANKTIVYPGSKVSFSDQSVGNPTSWSWTFPGGTPATSTEQNPVVTYNVQGIYPVTLLVNNSTGGDVITKSSFINVTQLVPQTGWSVKYVDSQNVTSTPATNVFDGSNSTFWGTAATPTACPHEIQIDMGTNATVSGFQYVPCQSTSTGRIAKYEFYVSTDGVNWGTPTNTGTWTNSAATQSLDFAPVTVRYFKLIALSEVNGGNAISVAELKIKVAADIASAVQENNLKEAVSIYSYLNEVKVEMNDFNTAKVQVFDVMGRQITEKEIGRGLCSITLNNSGIYIVKVLVNNSVISRKVILE